MHWILAFYLHFAKYDTGGSGKSLSVNWDQIPAELIWAWNVKLKHIQITLWIVIIFPCRTLKAKSILHHLKRMIIVEVAVKMNLLNLNSGESYLRHTAQINSHFFSFSLLEKQLYISWLWRTLVQETTHQRHQHSFNFSVCHAISKHLIFICLWMNHMCYLCIKTHQMKVHEQ